MREAKRRKIRTTECKAKGGVEAFRGMKTITELGQECGVQPVRDWATCRRAVSHASFNCLKIFDAS